MSISADTLQLLLDAGVEGAALVAVVRSIEVDNGPAQSGGAERQRRYREKLKAMKAGDVTRDVTDDVTPVTAPLILDKETSPRPPKEINPIPVCGDAPTRKATRISENWLPAKPLPPEVAELVAQWPPGRERRELDGFRDYWISRQRDAARTDWDRTWWNRIRDQHDRITRESRNGNRPANDEIQSPMLRAGLARAHRRSSGENPEREGSSSLWT